MLSSAPARNFLTNLVIGLALLFLLHVPWVQRNQVISGARDAVIAWQVAQLSGFDIDPRIAWINIDDTSRTAWHSSEVTPRDKLMTLIEFARRGQHKVILVDIDLSLRVSHSDAALQNYLRTYPQLCRTSCPPILLARHFIESTTYAYAGRNQKALQAQPSFLDQTLGTSPENPWNAHRIMWGSATWDAGVIRHWRLWEDSCAAPGKGIVTPSLVLLAAAMTAGIPMQRIRDALEPHSIVCQSDAQTSAIQEARSLPVTTLRVGKSDLTLTENASERWLFYRIPWSPRSAKILTLQAAVITANSNAMPDLLKGKVVVIGASTQTGSADIHQTPAGIMPGTLVLINAINTILTGKEIHETPFAWTIAIEIGLIVAVSLLFLFLPANTALLLSLALIVLGSLTAGFVALNSGVWFDSVLPLGGVLLHEAVSRQYHRRAHALP